MIRDIHTPFLPFFQMQDFAASTLKMEGLFIFVLHVPQPHPQSGNCRLAFAFCRMGGYSRAVSRCPTPHSLAFLPTTFGFFFRLWILPVLPAVYPRSRGSTKSVSSSRLSVLRRTSSKSPNNQVSVYDPMNGKLHP